MLEEPFLAHGLLFQVNSFITTMTGDICWGMAMYGCHHSEGWIFMLLDCIQLVIVYNIWLTVSE